MNLKARKLATLVALALALVAPDQALGQITVDSTDQFTMQNADGLKSVNDLSFDAAGSDKLVVVVSSEHSFNNGAGDITDIKYNGISLTPAVESKVDLGTAEIWYLDNPGAIGTGTIEIQGANLNGGIGTAYALSGTNSGFGATGATWTDTGTSSVSLTTTESNSLVIAVIGNSGSPNNSGTPTADSPMTQVSSGFWGSQWGGHASGYQQVPSPGLATSPFTTNTGSGYSINLAAIEILVDLSQITVDSTDQFTMQTGNGLKAVNDLSFDAGGSDKLVVVVSSEHSFNNGAGDITDIKYNGTSLTPAVESKIDRGTAEIWYLDNPGAIGTGTIEIQGANPNGGIGTAYALSGTQDGFGATGATWTDTGATEVSLTTTGGNSLVISVIDNSGNTNNSGTPIANPPMKPVSSGLWGNQWGGHASGYQQVFSPALVTASFNTSSGSGYSINMAAVEFLSSSGAGTLAFSNNPFLGGILISYPLDGSPLQPEFISLAVFPGGNPAADWEVRDPNDIWGELSNTVAGFGSGMILDTVTFPPPAPPLFQTGYYDVTFTVPDVSSSHVGPYFGMPLFGMPLYIVYGGQGAFAVISTGLSFQLGPLPSNLNYLFDEPSAAWSYVAQISNGGAGYRNGFSGDSDYDPELGLNCVNLATNVTGGRWRLAGGDSSYSLSEMCMPAGIWNLEFDPVAGFLTPLPQTVEVPLLEEGDPVPVVTYSYTPIATPWDEWIFETFPPTQHSDPLVVGPLRDPDNDRISNLLERAFHLDPTRPGPMATPPGSSFGGLPIPVPGSPSGPRRVALEFVRFKDPAAAGLSYLPEFGSDLISWPASGSLLSVESLDDDWERVVIEGPAGAPSGYGRVRVETLDP